MNGLISIGVLLIAVLSPLQQRTAAISGQVVDKDGQPATGIRVSAISTPDSVLRPVSASSLVSFVLTDSAGRYRLENVPPGRYYVAAGPLESLSYYPGVFSLADATGVNLTAGAALTGIDFK